jgi:hypothetical protein
LSCPKYAKNGRRTASVIIVRRKGDLVITFHPAVAGAAAGIALIALDERYGEFADRADVASATLVIVGAAITLSAVGRGDSARHTIAAYWIAAAVAALPLSIDAWCERRRRSDALRQIAQHLARRDYRAEAASSRVREH